MAEIKAKSSPYSLLTDKQIQALELLVKHKTSKEISRELGVSPHTVDQRIDAAKRRLGVSTRSQLVQAYLEQKRICHPLTYEESHIADTSNWLKDVERDNPDARIMFKAKFDHRENYLIEDSKGVRLVPEFFDGPKGTLRRLLTIFLLSSLIALTILAMATIYIVVSSALR